MIVILGPTASGKTRLASLVANAMDAEIISADSRQVFRGMDIGTGKDLDDCIVDGRQIPVHLIDIADAGEEYSVFRYQHDFLEVYRELKAKGKECLLCGGTGMYLSAVLLGYRMVRVPPNNSLRKELKKMTQDELGARLKEFKRPHNLTDLDDRERSIRAIEIARFYEEHPEEGKDFPAIEHTVFGIRYEREALRDRITHRLRQRLENGMVDEVRRLLSQGLKPEQLLFYGLEYKYITLHLLGSMSYEEMFSRLNTAIHQFSKRQMTWFRKMEKEGIAITWIPGELPLEMKRDFILQQAGLMK